MIWPWKKLTEDQRGSLIGKTSGEIISEITNGANLVNGKQTWEYSESHKDDIEIMKQCCAAELKTMKAANIVPAPFYFYRVAVLSRKVKDYEQEVTYCETYIKAVEEFYANLNSPNIADVRKGPRYKSIVDRLPKAKEFLNKCRSEKTGRGDRT